MRKILIPSRKGGVKAPSFLTGFTLDFGFQNEIIALWFEWLYWNVMLWGRSAGFPPTPVMAGKKEE